MRKKVNGARKTKGRLKRTGGRCIKKYVEEEERFRKNGNDPREVKSNKCIFEESLLLIRMRSQ